MLPITVETIGSQTSLTIQLEGLQAPPRPAEWKRLVVVALIIALAVGIMIGALQFRSSAGTAHRTTVTPTSPPSRSATSSTGTATQSASPTLRQGDSGAAVAKLQRVLRAVGYTSLPVTGFFGPLTDSAVRAFQRASGLQVTGVVDAATWTALERAAGNGSSTP